ncbi:MAG: aspartyl-phosphate phosphatase Spo0E family protein [Clostridia bacterium]|nr:aspartyl-phosphate phosphatase Spo0E family protein [Clostridia bacterium]
MEKKDEIGHVRNLLNDLIQKDADKNEILRISQLLDELIVEFMNRPLSSK